MVGAPQTQQLLSSRGGSRGDVGEVFIGGDGRSAWPILVSVGDDIDSREVLGCHPRGAG